MNSTSKPGSRISSSILMTSSSWQTARHRMAVANLDYTPGRVDAPFSIRRRGCRVRAMARRSYRPLAAASVVLAAIIVGATAAGLAAGQQVPAFRGGIDLVNIGVTVTERKGSLVTGLAVDDFE